MAGKASTKGAITVEAAIVLPIFICVVISLAMLIKLIYIHDIMQHAIDEAANELAAYSYIYHISDLQDIDDAIQDTIEDNGAQAEGHTETFIGAYNTMEESLQFGKEATMDIGGLTEGQGSFIEKAGGIIDKASSTYNSGTQLTRENIQNIKELQQAFEEISNNPRKELESVAWMLSKGIYSDAKSIVAVPVIRQTVKKYLAQNGYSNIDERINSLNIAGGFDGLDFYSSTFFDGCQDIDIVVKYRVKLPLPIKLLPDLYLAQRSTARAWLEGGDGEGLDMSDIWSLPNKERGMKIEQMLGGNLPYDFPVIDIYDQTTATGTSIKSINLNSKTYQSGEVLRKKLFAYVDALKDTNVISYKNRNYTLGNKRFVLVVPKSSQNEYNIAIIQQMTSYAEINGINITISEL